MAGRTIRRISGSLVIGRSSSLIGVEVTIHTLISNAIKTQIRFRIVAIPAIRQLVVSQQRKAVLLVYFGNIIHQPTVRIVATTAITPHTLLVQINMAIHTIRADLAKNQAFVTSPAIHLLVLSTKLKTGFFVIKTLFLSLSGHL